MSDRRATRNVVLEKSLKGMNYAKSRVARAKPLRRALKGKP